MIVNMSESAVGPVSVTVGDYCVLTSTAPPQLLDHYKNHADTVEHFEAPRESDRPGFFFLALHAVGREWPDLVVTQEFAPAGYGFHPGVLLVPETSQLFIGAGERLLAFESRTGVWRLQWTDTAEVGFWAWQQHGDVAVMAAELELAAWTLTGEKLWTRFVEPPWSYDVRGDQLDLDVMGEKTSFSLRRGTSAPAE